MSTCSDRNPAPHPGAASQQPAAVETTAVERTAIQVTAVLAADQPADLAAFYGALLDQAPQPGVSAKHCRVPLPEGGWLEIYRPSSARPQPRQRGRLGLCLRRDGGLADLEAWIDQGRRLGGQLLDGPRQESFGVEAWLLDPEGNALLLLVCGP